MNTRDSVAVCKFAAHLEDEILNGSEDWTELDQEGWENVLGSGRLRRKIINAAEVQEVRPTKGDYVKVSFKGVFEGKFFKRNVKLQ